MMTTGRRKLAGLAGPDVRVLFRVPELPRLGQELHGEVGKL
jgi:hypothetical protein